MKKTIAIFLLVCLILGLCACSEGNDDLNTSNKEIPTTVSTKPTECAHQFGEWVVTKKASYDSIGEERSTCEKCGEKKYRDIPMLEPVIVELTKDNFSEYFSIDCSVTDFERREGTIFYYGYATISVTCSLKEDCDISNVSVELELLPKGGIWDGTSYDPINFTIPTRTGLAETTQIVNVSSTSYSKIQKPSKVNFKIKNVTGSLAVYE